MQFRTGLFLTGIVALALIFYGSWRSCNPISKVGVVVEQLQNQVPTVNDKKLIPVNNRILTDVTIKPVVPNRFLKTTTKVITSVDNKCNTCVSVIQVDLAKTFFGLSFEPKIYAGVENNKFLIGYSQGFFRWGHVSTDLIIGFPAVGLGVSYGITNNFSLTAAGVLEYLDYTSIGNIGSYSLNTTDFMSIRPSFGLSFNLW